MLTDPAAFWAALTTEQAAALERAAPRIAGPWAEDVQMSSRAALEVGCANTYAAMVTPRAGAWVVLDGWGDRACQLCATREAAQAAADAWLVDDGWRLL